jgi:RNA-splicing ligase RtcB
MSMVYDVSNDLAKFEEYNVKGPGTEPLRGREGRHAGLRTGDRRRRMLNRNCLPRGVRCVQRRPHVVKACEGAGLSKAAARMRPVCGVKG